MNAKLIGPDRRNSGFRRVAAALVAATLVPAALSGCDGAAKNATHSSGTHSRSHPGAAHSGEAHSMAGPVNVFYAASLEKLFEAKIDPALKNADGVTVNGLPGGSDALASEIKAKSHRVDVFLSASPKVDKSLEGKANGDWVAWYISFGKAPLVIGYSAKSKFARFFKSEPWYRVVTKPGILVGRTDPTLDPKGKLTVQALEQASSKLHDPALAKLVTNKSGIFPEEDLVARLQSGQLDAGYFYTNEAKAAGMPTDPLNPVHVAATYTITILNRAANAKQAQALVKFLLVGKGRQILAASGLDLFKPKLSGSTKDVPSGLQSLTGSG